MFGLDEILQIFPALCLCVILGANNFSTCLGTSVGSRTLRYSHALVLGSVGLLAGLFIEGNKLSRVVTTGIVPSATPQLLFAVTVSSLIIMIFLTLAKLPISLSQVLVGAVVGAAIGSGIQVNWLYTIGIASSWIFTPMIAFMIGIMLTYLTKSITKRIRAIITLNRAYSYLTVVSGVYAAYTLGANTLGLIIGLDPTGAHSTTVSVIFGLATILGMFLFSRGTTRSVAENIIGMNQSEAFASQLAGAFTVQGFTELRTPVSVSQAVVGGIYGTTIPHKIVVRNDRLTRELIFGWTVAPLIGACLAFLIVHFT
ncbi:MAG: anion permease [Candidatus Bathyarchaeia archaeon]